MLKCYSNPKESSLRWLDARDASEECLKGRTPFSHSSSSPCRIWQATYAFDVFKLPVPAAALTVQKDFADSSSREGNLSSPRPGKCLNFCKEHRNTANRTLRCSIRNDCIPTSCRPRARPAGCWSLAVVARMRRF